MHPGVEPVLGQLGVLAPVLRAGFPRHRGIWIRQADEWSFDAYGEDAEGPWFGFQADRKVLQQVLQDAAARAGATLIRNTRPAGVLREAGRVVGVAVGGRPLHATWTVDATGQRAWLAEMLGLRARLASPRLGVRFGWRDDGPDAGDGQPAFAFGDDGWDWHAPLADGRVAWAALRIASAGQRAPRGVDVSWRIHPDCAGPGYFVLGDAAARLDPSASHGVLGALMSGILCGHLIEACRSGDLRSAEAADVYRSWQTARFDHDTAHLRRRYAGSPCGRHFQSGGGVSRFP